MRRLSAFAVLSCLIATVFLGSPVGVSAAPLPIYSNYPSPVPGNVNSEAFLAQTVSEVGDRIQFEPSTPRLLDSVQVLMSSWGCEAGTWNGSDCVTTPGATFSHPITLNFYNVGPSNAVGSLLGTRTQTFAIPYRPSADDVNCTGGNDGKWFNGTACSNGFATPITFDLTSLSLTVPDEVIVSIAFNTTSYGASPIGASTCSATPQGCGYDSLNVGLVTNVTSGANPAPNDAYLYAATSGGSGYCSSVGGLNVFRLDAGCWTDKPALQVFVAQCTTVCYVDDATGNDGNGGTSPADAKKTIQAGVDTVSPGGMVIVAAGAYTEDVSVNKTVDIRGAQFGIGVGARTFGDSSEATLEGIFRLGASGISVDGFSIQHHVTIVDESAEINVAQAGSGASITHNMFAHIISSAADDNALAHAIFLNNGPDNVTITDNSIDDVSSQGSAKGILIGDSSAINASLNIDIERNKITNVLSTNKGAYGILANNATGASPTIKFNRLDNFQGNWARAIALETLTPSGSVEFNVITNLTDQNSVLFPGQVAVYFESDASMANVGVHRNSLNVGTDSWGVAVNPIGPGGPVDATCNWWGNFTGPGSVASGGGSKVTNNVTYSPWLQTSNLNGDCEANGNITIILQTHPEPKQFSFTGTNGIAPFTLLDDGTAANTKSFSVPAGLYVFQIQAVSKWALISLTCNLHETILKSHRLVQIQLHSDQNVVCTFTESLRKPDASIALAPGGPYSGDNIYSSSVLASQTLSQAVTPGTTESFFVHLQNDGLDTDKFRLSSKLKGSLYYQVAFMSGTVEITGKVNAGTYRFKLAPGATKTIEIRVLAPLATPPGDTRNIVLTMQSRTAPAAVDVVKAFVSGP